MAGENTMMRRAMGTVVLVIFGMVCAGLVAELGVRVANHFFPYFYCYDAARGWGLRPNTAGYYRREGAAWVSINSAGFRGPEVPMRKPPGTIRIAVIGDSYTEAIQVPNEDTFASVAARVLVQCPLLKGRRVEALNFGVDGYGTTQELVTLREKVWAYQPDIVVLAIFLGNDVRNNSVTLEGNLCRPFYVERDGRLIAAGPFYGSNSFRLWCMARFDYRKSGMLSLLGNAWTILTTRGQQPSAELPIERAINYDIYKPPADPAWRDAWRVTEAMVAQMQRESAAHGAAFLAVTLDTSIQVWPDPQVRDNFMKRIDVGNLFYPDRRIAALGEKEGFDVLTLAEPLYQYARAHHAYLHGFPNSKIGFGHWNAEGHRVAGRLIGERLCDMIRAGKCPNCAAAPERVSASVGSASEGEERSAR
ncbi:MAG TPA: SGNH/GDSL hydrolase family protein [Candidatus Binataceae bacterium]|nr:SGNH/GDSL hydrolase family protein [Candidatus Binataceae bacterium]